MAMMTSRPILLFGFLLVIVLVAQLQNQSQLDSIRPFFLGFSGTNENYAAASSYYTCPFRNHSRYYGLTDDAYPPSFLRSAFYMHGKPPTLLPLASTSTKICYRPSLLHLQLKIQNLTTGRPDILPLTQPLMDGTNPTLVSLHRLRRELSPTSLETFQYLWQQFPTAAYLVSNTFKSANQCNYDFAKKKKDKHSKKEYVVTDGNRPPGRQHRNEVDLILVDAQFRTLWQTTIRSRRHNNTSFSADDARLLVHNGDIFLTFKRYKDHGGNGAALYLAQLGGIVRDDMEGARSLQVHAVREWAMCCGRNFMALSSSEKHDGSKNNKKRSSTSNILSFMTWPDPIWVQSLDTATPTPHKDDLSTVVSIGFDAPSVSSQNAMGKTSKFHGTSGFLLYLPDTREYLGIGHLHRERKWAKDSRMDARFGHHYTHAFFTMTSEPPYQLTRLSAEFLFPSTTDPKDADIIQFASGLEWAQGGDDDRRQIVIAYGINDCEGAVVHVDWETVQGLLLPVPKGSQVVHTIANMTREAFQQPIEKHT